MKKYILLIFLILVVLGLAVFLYLRRDNSAPVVVQSTPGVITDKIFTDGLGAPVFAREFELDESGAGIAEMDVFDADNIRVTRTRVENGTAHFYFQYTIELNGRDITPPEFRTTEGAECALTKIQFQFNPLRITKILRPWRDTWTTPTPATRIVYTLQDGELVAGAPTQLRAVCDVGELF